MGSKVKAHSLSITNSHNKVNIKVIMIMMIISWKMINDEHDNDNNVK